jgi:hypothetical protein
MLLQVEAQVEERLAQDPAVTEQQGDQEPAHPSVAVEERVDGLELDVRQSRPQAT